MSLHIIFVLKLGAVVAISDSQHIHNTTHKENTHFFNDLEIIKICQKFSIFLKFCPNAILSLLTIVVVRKIKTYKIENRYLFLK